MPYQDSYGNERLDPTSDEDYAQLAWWLKALIACGVWLVVLILVVFTLLVTKLF